MASISFPSSPSNGDTYSYDGLTYQYNSTKNKWSVVATTTIDGVSADAIDQNLVPSANVTYDLGTADKAFKDLYLSGNTLVLGSASITSTESGTIALPAGTKIGSHPGISNAELQTVLANTNAYVASVSDAQSQYLQVANVSSYGFATESYVDTSVASLVNSAPTTLNTLDELASALGDDANFATTTTALIGTKASNAYLTSTYTTNTDFQSFVANTNAYIATVAESSGGGGTTLEFTANGVFSLGDAVQIATNGAVYPIIGSGGVEEFDYPYGSTSFIQNFHSSPGSTNVNAYYAGEIVPDPSDPSKFYIFWDDNSGTQRKLQGTSCTLASDGTFTFTAARGTTGTHGSIAAKRSKTDPSKILLFYSNASGYPCLRQVTIGSDNLVNYSNEVVLYSQTYFPWVALQGNHFDLSDRDGFIWMFQAGTNLILVSGKFDFTTNTVSALTQNYVDTSGPHYYYPVAFSPLWTVDNQGESVFALGFRNNGSYRKSDMWIRPGRMNGAGGVTLMNAGVVGPQQDNKYMANPYLTWDPFHPEICHFTFTSYASYTNDVLYQGIAKLNSTTLPVTQWDVTYARSYGTTIRAGYSQLYMSPYTINTGTMIYTDAVNGGLSRFDIELDKTTAPYVANTENRIGITGVAGFGFATIGAYLGNNRYAINGYDSNNNYARGINIFSLEADTRSTNFDANLVIGVAESSAANGATVTVTPRGSVSSAFSSLSPSSDYYVHANGTIDATYNVASLKIGKAVSANTMILTGV